LAATIQDLAGGEFTWNGGGRGKRGGVTNTALGQNAQPIWLCLTPQHRRRLEREREREREKKK